MSLFAKWFAGIGLLIMTAIIAMQVFARYVLNNSPAWAEQAALLLMIWYVFIAAAAGVREGFHIRIAIFADKMPPKVRHPVLILAHLVVVAFGISMAIFGVQLAQETWQHVIPTLGLSRGYAYIPIALSGVLMTGFAVEQLIAELRSTEVPKLWN
ncbi:MAG: TRAP transporter small permease [Xanthomonadales bacterium]|nr:TRAP transporter small permease [Xanthomonadales bacterium]